MASSQKARASVTMSGEIVRKADTKAVIGQPLEVEDKFQSLYEVTEGGIVIMTPPFNPSTLIALCTRNNILQQCIHAMEVNVDGTGYTIEPINPPKREPKPVPPPPEIPPDPKLIAARAAEAAAKVKNAVTAKKDDAEDADPEKKFAEEFFNEPYPGMSMVTLRRKLRVDLEQTGCGYLEVLRNAAGEMMFLRHVDASTVRLLKYDAPVQVTKKVSRRGQDTEVLMQVRERRFIQIVGNNRMYYREFGSSRQLNRKNGTWIGPKDKALKPDEVGTELLYFIVDRDAQTPYGQPRWLNNLPSVLGSRKAEEYNLDFFDAGGLPPALIIVAGGAMTGPVKEQLMNYLSGKSRTRHRAAVVEVQSASGGVDQTGKVDVKVERFGDARQNDSMFQNYDEKTEEHVRVAFRLPPLFIGRSSDFSFATAMTSYMIAEEQVFAPERLEFDEIMNNTIMKELGVTKYKFVSKPTTLKNIEVMLEAVNLCKDVIDGEERVEAVNMIAGTKLTFSQAAEQKSAQQSAKTPFNMPGASSSGGGGQLDKGARAMGGVPLALNMASGVVGKNENGLTANDIVALVGKWTVAAKLEEGEMSDEERYAVLGFVDMMKGDERLLFDKVLAKVSFVNASPDLPLLSDISGACAHMSSARKTLTVSKDDSMEKLARVFKESQEQTLGLIRDVLAQTAVNEQRPFNLTIQMPGRVVKKQVTFSDGRKAAFEKKDGKSSLTFLDGRKVEIE